MIRIIIYLHDLLILGNSMSETFTARHSVIFLLQHLGFMINLKKCVLDPVQEIEFLWLIVNPNYDFVITREENREDKRSVPEFIQSFRGITSGFVKTNRSTFFNHSISAPSPCPAICQILGRNQK